MKEIVFLYFCMKRNDFSKRERHTHTHQLLDEHILKMVFSILSMYPSQTDRRERKKINPHNEDQNNLRNKE